MMSRWFFFSSPVDAMQSSPISHAKKQSLMSA
jgi:hypothetical protein